MEEAFTLDSDTSQKKALFKNIYFLFYRGHLDRIVLLLLDSF